MVATHCIPAGTPWNSTQVTRPGVNTGTTVRYVPSGLRRGRVIYLPSTAAAASQISQFNTSLADQNTFLQNLLLDGWEVFSVNNLGVYTPIAVAVGAGTDYVAQDVSNDAGHGTRLTQTLLHYWDHIKLYADNTFGKIPTVVAGFSFGAFQVPSIAINRTSDLIGYISRSCPTQWSNTSTTASSMGYPQLAGVNTTGIDLQTMARITVNSMSISGSVATLNCASSVTSISPTQYVVVESPVNGAGGANWANLYNAWPVASSSGSTLTVTLSGITLPTGTGGTATVRSNSSLNAVTVPGAMMTGSISGDNLINPADVWSMAQNAALAGKPVTLFSEPEFHVWSTTDSNLFSVNTYDPSVTYLTGIWVFYLGNVYQALQSTTGNLPTGGAPNWSSGTAQTAQGWVQTTLDPSYPRAY